MSSAELADLWYTFLEEAFADEIETAAERDADAVEIPYDEIDDHNPDLADDLCANPERVIAPLRRAIKEYLESEHPPSPTVIDFPDSRLYDVGTYHPDEVVGELVALRGQVTKRSDRQLRDLETAFECMSCGTMMTISQERGKLQTPYECKGCEKKGPWQEDVGASSYINYQEARVQALPEHTGHTSGETIDVELTNESVGTVSPGDRVLINAEIGADRIGETTVRELFADAHSTQVLDGSHKTIDHEEYIEEIEELVDTDDIYGRVTSTIAPGHYGDSKLKLALALAIFGGVEKELPDGSTKRGNSHILVIGDPGTGKSKLLNYVAEIAPRSEFASGRGASAAGLTATAVNDDFGGSGWSLEAGTLPRAHEGIACIDELDKMEPDDRAGMIQAMSEQKITIEKAASGTLPSKTTVIAAANPKYGSFNPMGDLDDQLDFHAALLNRFDLIFVMRDEVDEEMDREIADHMNTTTRIGQAIAAGETEPDEVEDESVAPAIEPELFRAYVSYAQTFVPQLTDDADELIADDYVELRQSNEESDGPIPVTARSVDGVHRLAEASARIRLSDEITTADVERAHRIRDYCFEQLGIDPETGELDAMRLETGEPSSAKEREQFITQKIESYHGEADDGGAPADEVREVCLMVMEADKYEDRLEKLKTRGDVYEPTKDKTLRYTG